jgi:formamidopyrimidine-DNA glycosylase
VPELPEVETIRRGLEREVVGKRIKSVEVSGMRSIRRHPTALAACRGNSWRTRSGRR